MTANSAGSGASQLAIYQGSYDNLGTLDQAADHFAAANTIVLSHVSSVATANGCQDTAYADIDALIAKIRERNPNAVIFGYVPSTADAPGCGTPASANWSCPNGICSQFIDWVNQWYALAHRPDGIFVDLVGRGWVSAIDRDNEFSYVRALGLMLMPNTPVYLDNVQFAFESSYLDNQSVLVEGYCYANGAYQVSDCDAIDAFLWDHRDRNVARAALVTEAWGTSAIDCGSPNAIEASRRYWSIVTDRDSYEYTSSDLGLVAAYAPRCSPVWPLP